MDKYQKYVLDKYKISKEKFIFSECCPIDDETKCSPINYGEFDDSTDNFNILQDENINKTQYILVLESIVQDIIPFQGVFIEKNKKWSEVPCKNGQYRVTVDFNDRTNAIKFVFKNQIVPDYTLKVSYIEADKEKYYEKVAEEEQIALKKAANIKVSTGIDLVNIYFCPCCDCYDHTEILLYIPDEKSDVCNAKHKSNSQTCWSLIKKNKILSGEFYLSIKGLAYGKYSFVLKQYDANDNVLIETEHITFLIDEPNFPNLGHLNII